MAIEYISLHKTKWIWVGLLFIVFPTASYAFQYKDLDLKLTGTITEMYDDNISFANTKEDKREDYITTLGLGLKTKYEGRRRSLDLSGNLNYRFNARYEDIENNSENAGINFQNIFSEYSSIGLRYTFSHSHTPETFVEELDRISGRRETFKHYFIGNYLMYLSERFRINAKYSSSLTQFSEVGRDDISNNRIGIDTMYSAGSATTLSLSYSYGRNNFDEEIHTTYFGVKYDITERSYVSGRVGWDSTYYSDQRNDNVNIDISFNNQIDENSSASISYSQEQKFSAESGNISSLWQVQGMLSRELLKRIIASLSFYYGEDTYDQFISSNLFETTNTLLGADFLLSYELWEDARADMRYTYSDLESSNQYVGYTRNTFTLGLSQSF